MRLHCQVAEAQPQAKALLACSLSFYLGKALEDASSFCRWDPRPGVIDADDYPIRFRNCERDRAFSIDRIVDQVIQNTLMRLGPASRGEVVWNVRESGYPGCGRQ